MNSGTFSIDGYNPRSTTVEISMNSGTGRSFLPRNCIYDSRNFNELGNHLPNWKYEYIYDSRNFNELGNP